MSEWTDRVTDLLYEGETVEREVSVGPNDLYVTSHRLLAFTPEGGGPNYRHVDLPNVGGAEVKRDAAGRYLRWATRPLALGVLGVAGGATISLDGTFSGVDTQGAGRVTGGTILGMIDAMRTAAALFDDVLMAGGAVALLIAVALGALYLRSRERYLAIDVAGGDAVRLDGVDDPDAAAVDVRAALAARDHSSSERPGSTSQ